MNPLIQAIENKNYNQLRLLIELGHDVNVRDEYGYSLLHIAIIQEASIDLICLLIESGADVNENVLLFKSVNFFGLTEILISWGADANTKDGDGKTPLFHAVYKNLYEEAKILIDNGADVNAKDKEGKTPLFDAAKGNSLGVVDLLIAKGADINAKDNFGKTALFLAAEEGSKEVAELLILRGANTIDKDGNTPLHIAAKRNDISLAKFFIGQGMDVNAKNNINETPIFYSIQIKTPEVFNWLIVNGADLKVQNAYGYSLLHIACYRNAIDCAKILIEKGLDINIKDNHGKAPITMVNTSYQNQLFELLLKNGPKEV